MKIFSGFAVQTAMIDNQSFWIVVFNTIIGEKISKSIFRTESEADKFIVEVLGGSEPHIVDVSFK